MTTSGTSNCLSNLQTESCNVRSSNIDVVSSIEMCQIMNGEDSQVAAAVGYCLEDIAAVVDLVAERVKKNGRVIYIGAGTSGRLGVLDASEIPPTFSAPYSQFIGIMAGGDTAIRRAVEGAEDSTSLAADALRAIDPPLSQLDTLIGIATSGRTPYVLGGLSYAQGLGILTVGICCVKPSNIRDSCDYVIECLVGPEVVTGSTRLKAGTATKLILNMISTCVMIRIGKTYGNLMVDVKPSNVKLQDRARRIFRAVLPTTSLSDSRIDDLLKACHDNVKLALVVERHSCTIPDATKILADAEGVLKLALQVPGDAVETLPVYTFGPNEGFVLCIDAGGTKCKAAIANQSGTLSRGEAGPCNFVTLGHDIALSVLSQAVTSALAGLPPRFGVAPELPPKDPIFVGAWIGGAGLDRTADLASIRLRLITLLNLPNLATLKITNDAALLSSAIVTLGNVDQGGIRISGGIVLVAGTGTIAHSYAFPTDGHDQLSLPKPTNRASGWGYLLGDEGSAFAIGRDAIRAALDRLDLGLPATSLHLAITEYFGCRTVGELISAVYLNVPPVLKEQQDPSSVDSDPKLRVAGICRVVFKHAFAPVGSKPDTEALEIVRKAAESAADVIIRLLIRDSGLRSATSVLVFGGALAQVEEYRGMIIDSLLARGHSFARVRYVADAAEEGIQVLKREFLA